MNDHKDKEAIKTPISKKEAKIKICAYCAYQERTQMEARNKLYEYGLTTNDIEDILADLISENFINEERFAITYAGGKFRIKKWGKLKIKAGLKFKGISEYCLKAALQSIDENDYYSTLAQILEKRYAIEKEKNPFTKKDKISKYAISRGFEPELVWSIINEGKPH